MSNKSQNPIDERIVKFIKKHHVLTLATSKNNVPYTCSCFYTYIAEENMFVITSDLTTRHANEMLEQPLVAGSIAWETKIVGKIQGVQFTGKAIKLEDKKYKNAYIKAFPIATLAHLELWGIIPDYLKMTHNSLGFGKKLIWKEIKL